MRLVAPDGTTLWTTATGGRGGELRLLDDGDVVVTDAAGAVVWRSETAQAPSALAGPGRLGQGDVLTSPDGRHVLLVDPEQGVRLIGPDGAVRWEPEPAGVASGARTGARASDDDVAVGLELRADGNLVAVGEDGDRLWRSRTAGRGATSLEVRDDGTLVLLDEVGGTVWSSGAPIGPARLGPGAALTADVSLGSPSGHLGLAVADGALVATWDGEPFWRAPADGVEGAVLQDDGNLVLLDSTGSAVWDTGTAGRDGAALVLEETAALLLSTRGEVLWQVAVPPALVPTGVQPADCDLVDGPVAHGDTVLTRAGVRVHPCLADALDALVAAARADGIELRGGGWRSPDQQIALRRAHCGPSDEQVYDVPASACTPSTARPGTSRHERGLAIDFTVGGRTLTSGSTAYGWLVEHAGAYGLENLPGEPWHWSTDGS